MSLQSAVRRSAKGVARRLGIRVQRIFTVPHAFDAEPRLQILVEYARSVRAPGAVAEAGVYQGRTAVVLRAELQRDLYLLDTFEGMPAIITERDRHRAGDFADTSLDLVKQRVGTDRVFYLPGLFSQRFPEIEGERFAFVHVDCDLYESVKECLEFFGPRMNAGGIMVLDDYGFASCPGAMQATDEWGRETNRHPVWLPTGQAVVHF